MKTCFFVSPIGQEGSDTRNRADKVFKYIVAPVCESCEVNPVRVDQLNQADAITQTIIDHLLNDELVIADMTEHNPNAFYEMGFRACTKKPMINIKAKGEAIPFDIANIRAFDYDLTDLDSVEEVKTRLVQTIRSMNLACAQEKVSGDENVTATSASNSFAEVMPILYDIQDKIEGLTTAIQNKDNETLKAIVQASRQPAVVEDTNTAMMKILLPELLRNPAGVKQLLELSESYKKDK